VVSLIMYSTRNYDVTTGEVVAMQWGDEPEDMQDESDLEAESKKLPAWVRKITDQLKVKKCNNRECYNKTELRYCTVCYESYQAKKLHKCISTGCFATTTSRYCRECRFNYRHENHKCEVCKQVFTDRKWCIPCFSLFPKCGYADCVKKVQPKFKLCWEHFRVLQ
jgi:hypothetical protein